MSKSKLQLGLLLSCLLLITSCNQQNNDELEQEIKELRADIAQLNAQLNLVASQVEDIHVIAKASQQPQTKTLPNQANINDKNAFPELGEDTATVAIIEFSDFQCPYCKRFMDTTFPKLSSNYIETGKVRYISRDFPLGFHTKAKGAAVAANCAHKQGKYWPMRELLFTNMRSLGDELYQQGAQTLSLDMSQYQSCLVNPQIMAKVDKDLSYGSSLGIRGTPSFVIGKIVNNQLVEPQLLVGAQSYETFANIVDNLVQN
ncbi:DsbA family protein [Pseudoalteromonas sp. SSDWG2]|uniref:DsbA family protein n=1 Tax=Pseudoalteromonas sp. SSDWG2 TaxID=3139391 RepID=UPI003BAD052F